MSDFIDINGSEGEGGGQILRSALSLSLLTGRPFRLHHIRANRPKPGLQPQHLMSVRAAERVGSAHVRGASLNSSELTFEPGPVGSSKYTFDIGTAGATGLVLHTVYLPLALRGVGPSEVIITGGTHVRTSPSFPFLDLTWRTLLQQLGLNIGLELQRPGFYPRGGGAIRAVVPAASALQPVRWLERGEIQRVEIVAAVAGLEPSIARRMARRLTQRLKGQGQVHSREEVWPGGPGCVVWACLHITPAPIVFAAMGERGKSAEAVADQVSDQLHAYLKAAPATLDAHSGDQMLLPLALASGPSEYHVAEVTRHLTTNAQTIRLFLDCEITVEGDEGQPGRVCVHPNVGDKRA
jgi:RNA 3'-terminal phosphate cyclase (ATP)